LYVWFRAPGADFCRRLAERERVSVVPGSAFGPRGEGWARLSLGASVGDLETGGGRVARFLARRLGGAAS
ncbi:MAG: pyridoxal phosphate-dependent aminotransferase, partial [Acidobacteriota bacterium]